MNLIVKCYHYIY